MGIVSLTRLGKSNEEGHMSSLQTRGLPREEAGQGGTGMEGGQGCVVLWGCGGREGSSNPRDQELGGEQE